MSRTFFCSGSRSMTGYGVSSLNSQELAPSRPQTLRAYSMTAHCMPRQTPRYGTLFSRQNWMASILPSMPRMPKPPGTMTPSARLRRSATVSRVSSSESTQRISSLRPWWMAECLRASQTERYASWSCTYLPTRAMVTGSVASPMRSTRPRHSSRSGASVSILSMRTTRSSRPSWCMARGTL